MASNLPDCKAFRDMWDRGEKQDVIAKHFGVSHGLVSANAKRYGYPVRPRVRDARRGSGARHSTKIAPSRQSQTEEKILKTTRAESLAGDRWTAAQVIAVFRTGGKYAQISALADTWGVPTTAVVGLWHRVRVTT
jgi:transposase